MASPIQGGLGSAPASALAPSFPPTTAPTRTLSRLRLGSASVTGTKIGNTHPISSFSKIDLSQLAKLPDANDLKTSPIAQPIPSPTVSRGRSVSSAPSIAKPKEMPQIEEKEVKEGLQNFGLEGLLALDPAKQRAEIEGKKGALLVAHLARKPEDFNEITRLFEELKTQESDPAQKVKINRLKELVQDQILHSEKGPGIKETLFNAAIKHLSFTNKEKISTLYVKLENQIKVLEGMYQSGDVKTELMALKQLRQEIFRNPLQVLKKRSENKNELLFKILDADGSGIKFLSRLLQSDSNTKGSAYAQYGLSDTEKVALYGYTTGDFKVINQSLRMAKGEKITDESITLALGKIQKVTPAGEEIPLASIKAKELIAYVSLIDSCLKKLPNCPTKMGDEEVKLVRALKHLPEPEPDGSWLSVNMRSGRPFSDYAFVSATNGENSGGAATFKYVTQTELDQEWPNAKVIGLLSAFPGELEVVFLRDTEFVTKDIDKNTYTLKVLRTQH